MNKTMTMSATGSRAVSASEGRRIIIGASIGNAMEWYDFLIYGLFASMIAKAFFPAHNEWVSLLLSTATFGVSFLIRPIGAVVLGRYADRKGRRAALSVSIILMALGTLVIAVMPTYNQIGIIAPIAILLARLMQGFAVAGEFGSSTAFLVEHSPNRKGFYASWQFATQGLATIAAAGFGNILASHLSLADLESWGWRIAFLIGLLIAPVGFYIRRHLNETPEFIQMQKSPSPTGDVTLGSQIINVLLAVGMVAQSTVSVYVLQLYMPIYAARELGLPVAQSFAVVVLGGAIQFLLSPIMGALSDRIGRIRIMLTTSVVLAASIYPMFYMLNQYRNVWWLLGMLALAGTAKACYSGPMPALMSEIFPAKSRSTSLSLSYNIGATLFGGFSPFFVTWLIGVSGSKLAPSYYVIAATVISGISLTVVAIRMRRTAFGKTV